MGALKWARCTWLGKPALVLLGLQHRWSKEGQILLGGDNTLDWSHRPLPNENLHFNRAFLCLQHTALVGSTDFALSGDTGVERILYVPSPLSLTAACHTLASD